MSKADIDELRIVVQADDKDASKTLDALVSKLTALKEASKGFRKNKALESWATKAEEANNSLSAMAKTIDAVSSSIASLNDSMKSFSSGIKGATSDAKGLEKALQSSESMKGTTEAAAKASDAIETATTKARGFSSVFSGIGTVARGVGGFFSRVGQIGATAFGKIQSATHATVSTIKRIGSVVSNTATQFGKISKSALSFATLPFKPVINGVKSIDDRLFGVFKSLLRIAKLRIFRGIIKSITAGLREGIANAYQWANVMGNQFAGSMDRVATSAQYLKNSLGAMAMPIFNALAPVLDALIDKVVTLLNAINQLIAKLTGASSWTKAVKVPKAYASGMADAAGSAEKLKQELITILGIDELNVMEGANDSGSGGGGGGAGGGFTEMFEESTFSDNINNLADMIKKAWANADFTDIGTMIGEKIKGALDGIPWDTKIKPVASKLGKSLATLLNGVIEVEGLGTSIGETIAQAYNTALNFAYDFVHNLHWDSLGEFIGDTINGFTSKVDLEKLRQTARELGTGIGNTINSAFETTDWEGVGNTIAQSMNSVFDFLYNLGSTIKWEDIGSDLATAFNTWQENFDFEQAGATLGTWASGLLDLFVRTVQDIKWSDLGSKVGELIAAVDWSDLISKAMEGIGSLVGGFAAFAAGLFSDLGTAISDYFSNHNILDALGDIGTWIYNNIISPFITGLDKGFNNEVDSNKFDWLKGLTIEEAEVKVNASLGRVEKGLEKFFGIELEDKTYDLNTRINIALGEVDATARRILNKLFPNLGLSESSSLSTPTVGVGGMLTGASGVNIQGVTAVVDKVKDEVPEKMKTLGGGKAEIAGVTYARQLKPAKIDSLGMILSGMQDEGYMPAKIDTQGLVTSATQGRGYRAPTISTLGQIISASTKNGYVPTVEGDWKISSKEPVNKPKAVLSEWDIGWIDPKNPPKSIISRWDIDQKDGLNPPEKVKSIWNIARKIAEAPPDIFAEWNLKKKTQNVPSTLSPEWDLKKKTQNVPSTLSPEWDLKRKTQNVPSTLSPEWDLKRKTQNVPETLKSVWDLAKQTRNIPEAIKSIWDVNRKTQNVPSELIAVWKLNGYNNSSVPKVSTQANLDSYKNNLTGADRPVISAKASFVDWRNSLPSTPSINVRANIIQTGTNYAVAKGGVFERGRWHGISQFAAGGIPTHGSTFIAGEAGPELVGHVRGRTEVLNQSQLAATMSASMTEAQAPQNALLREQNALLRELINAQGNIRATISSGDVVNGLQQKNRRDGRTIVPIGV